LLNQHFVFCRCGVRPLPAGSQPVSHSGAGVFDATQGHVAHQCCPSYQAEAKDLSKPRLHQAAVYIGKRTAVVVIITTVLLQFFYGLFCYNSL
jgi:hypothetical protein